MFATSSNMFATIILTLLLSSTTDFVYGRVVYEHKVEIHRWIVDGNETINGNPVAVPLLGKSKQDLYQLVANGQYDTAVSETRAIDRTYFDGLISETVQKLLDSQCTDKSKVMSFAYKLWSSGAKDVVQRHFPAAFKNILDQDYVKIVNKEYGQALKLDVNTDRDGDRYAWGDSHQRRERHRMNWKFMPVWENNEVTFKIYNIDRSMYLKLAVAVDGDGDRRAFGSNNADTDRDKFYLEPHNEGGDLVFFIINKQYGQGLKLIVAADDIGDRSLMSHNGDIYAANTERFRWIISEW